MNSLKFQDRLLGLQDNLLNFAYMLTANREEAKDLLQDTTLKALDNEDKYIDNVNFKGWVFTIMRNIFINNYRRVVREPDYYRPDRRSVSLEFAPRLGIRVAGRFFYGEGDYNGYQ